MSSSVNLPLWIVVAGGLLAAAGLLDRLLVPTVRWFLRRRLNRAIADLNARLKLKIQPFKLARRKVLIDNLLFDADVLQAIEDEAALSSEPHDVVMARAKHYAKEIVPSFSTYAYFNVGTKLAKWVCNLLYRVRLGAIDEEALAAIGKDSSVVFVINHRSNMDYVLVTYVASTSSALSYAVGEWARVWLLQSLIRAMGGYFVRRDSSNPLYRKILSRYVHMSTAAGVTQAVFPEGGLTRDGALRPPKLGLLSYMVSGFDPHGGRDIVFVPVGLNYDRVLEDRILTAAAAASAQDKAGGKPPGKPKFKFSPAIAMGFLLRNLWRKLRGRWYSYGYAAVSFGRPISLRDYLANRAVDLRTVPEETRFKEIERLGAALMHAVGQVVPALPVTLVARALLDAGPEGLTGIELKGAVLAMTRQLNARGAYVHIPRADLEYAITVGLRQLTLRHLAVERAGVYRAAKGETALLKYYANAIAHLIPKVPADERASIPLVSPLVPESSIESPSPLTGRGQGWGEEAG